MLKKKFIILGAVAVFIGSMMIPTVRAAAESALSIFRVDQTKTISITANDLQDMMTAAKDPAMSAALQDAVKAAGAAVGYTDPSDAMKDAESRFKPIGNIHEFTAFPFSLPADLKDETPVLYAADAQTKTVTLDTAVINDLLTRLGASKTVDGSLNGTTFTVTTPPAILARYADVELLATQRPYTDAPADVVNVLKTALLSVPAIPQDLRAQLMTVDPSGHDIYLPVLEGLGRETDLGGTTGYIYTAGDLYDVLSALPQPSGDSSLEELQNKNASVLTWTKGGVLYCLDGEKSDSALTQLARSVY